MKSKILILIITAFLSSGFICFESKSDSQQDLVKTATWYIAGPAVENQEIINKIRKKEGIVKVTAKDNPVGEIELNVMITESDSNDGAPTNISDASKLVTITYKSSHQIKIQAREGNDSGTGCVHGGTHAMADLPASPDKFVTIKIPWLDFKLNGKPVNIHNLCKFNFVNYHPVSGAFLEIKSVIID